MGLFRPTIAFSKTYNLKTKSLDAIVDGKEQKLVHLNDKKHKNGLYVLEIVETDKGRQVKYNLLTESDKHIYDFYEHVLDTPVIDIKRPKAEAKPHELNLFKIMRLDDLPIGKKHAPGNEVSYGGETFVLVRYDDKEGQVIRRKTKIIGISVGVSEYPPSGPNFKIVKDIFEFKYNPDVHKLINTYTESKPATAPAPAASTPKKKKTKSTVPAVLVVPVAPAKVYARPAAPVQPKEPKIASSYKATDGSIQPKVPVDARGLVNMLSGAEQPTSQNPAAEQKSAVWDLPNDLKVGYDSTKKQFYVPGLKDDFGHTCNMFFTPMGFKLENGKFVRFSEQMTNELENLFNEASFKYVERAKTRKAKIQDLENTLRETGQANLDEAKSLAVAIGVENPAQYDSAEGLIKAVAGKIKSLDKTSRDLQTKSEKLKTYETLNLTPEQIKKFQKECEESHTLITSLEEYQGLGTPQEISAMYTENEMLTQHVTELEEELSAIKAQPRTAAAPAAQLQPSTDVKERTVSSCTKCGKKLMAGWKKCPYCLHMVEQAQPIEQPQAQASASGSSADNIKKCWKCGSTYPIKPGQTECTACGAHLKSAPAPALGDLPSVPPYTAPAPAPLPVPPAKPQEQVVSEKKSIRLKRREL